MRPAITFLNIQLSNSRVNGNSVPHLILHNQHPDLFQLFSKLFDIKTDNPVIQFHICPMIEYFPIFDSWEVKKRLYRQ